MRPPLTASRQGRGISVLAALLMAFGTSREQTLCLCVCLTLGLEQVSCNTALAPAKTEVVSAQTRWSVAVLLGFYVGSPTTRLHINRFGLDSRVLHSRCALCLVLCPRCRRVSSGGSFCALFRIFQALTFPKIIPGPRKGATQTCSFHS